jgi:hypothetical protein
MRSRLMRHSLALAGHSRAAGPGGAVLGLSAASFVAPQSASAQTRTSSSDVSAVDEPTALGEIGVNSDQR